MTFAEFNEHDLTSKSDLVWEWGHYLASRRNETHNVVLFLVNDFFAEVHIALSDNTTTYVNGIQKNKLPKEFREWLNPEDPFIKAVLSAGSSSRPETA